MSQACSKHFHSRQSPPGQDVVALLLWLRSLRRREVRYLVSGGTAGSGGGRIRTWASGLQSGAGCPVLLAFVWAPL